jgi:HAMP domain-containing protein
MGAWLDSITAWLTVNPSWLGAAIFLVSCLECLAIAGIVVPGTVALFAIAALAGSGILPLSEALLLGFLGGLLGDVMSYFVGRRFHQNIRRLPGLRHRQPAGRSLHRPTAPDVADGGRDVRHAIHTLRRGQRGRSRRLVSGLHSAGLGDRRGHPPAAA